MTVPPVSPAIQHEVAPTLEALRRSGFQRLRFAAPLESKFENDTRKIRAHRLWMEGLISILVFNACLMVDYLLVGDAPWQDLVWRTAIVTPLALLVNMIMRFNPPRWLREGSVAGAMIMICWINLGVQGTSSAAHALFGSVCSLITALFCGVVMRLRFRYAAASLFIMLLSAVWCLTRAEGMTMPEVVVATSLLIMAQGIILIAGFSLEREERLGWLLCLQGEIQTRELAVANEELQRLSTLDKLTGLPNRRALEDRFEKLWKECMESAQSLAAVVIDIDHFKVVNDVYGHIYGDEALRRIAELLPKALRGPKDMAARFGGEEFVILLPNAEKDLALRVAERVRTLVETAGTPLTSHPSGETMMWATVSCGVSFCVPAEGLTTTQLLDAADKGLYTAKRAGRNCVKFADCIDAPAPVVLEVVAEREKEREKAPLPFLVQSRREKSGIRAVLTMS